MANRQRRNVEMNKNKTHADLTISVKRCSTCKEVLSILEFPLNRTNRDCLHRQCNTCVSLEGNSRRIRNRRKNKRGVSGITHKVCTKCKRDLDIASFGIMRRNSDGYQRQCKHCLSIVQGNRKQLKKSNERITAKLISELKTLYKHCCAYCDRRPRRLHIDHVLPICLGGKDTRDNLLPACSDCNLTKNASTPEQWFARIGRSFAFNGKWLVRVS
jgi:hypothetical protein